jgi:hypothetical protein
MELTECCHHLITSYVVGRVTGLVDQLYDTRLVDGKAAMHLEYVIARTAHSTSEKST